MDTPYHRAIDLYYTTATLIEECRHTLTQTTQIQDQSHKLQARLEACQQCYIVIICAWCQTRIGVQPTTLPQSNNESHGICQSCGDRLEANLKQSEDTQNVVAQINSPS